MHVLYRNTYFSKEAHLTEETHGPLARSEASYPRNTPYSLAAACAPGSSTLLQALLARLKSTATSAATVSSSSSSSSCSCSFFAPNSLTLAASHTCKHAAVAPLRHLAPGPPSLASTCGRSAGGVAGYSLVVRSVSSNGASSSAGSGPGWGLGALGLWRRMSSGAASMGGGNGGYGAARAAAAGAVARGGRWGGAASAGGTPMP